MEWVFLGEAWALPSRDTPAYQPEHKQADFQDLLMKGAIRVPQSSALPHFIPDRSAEAAVAMC